MTTRYVPKRGSLQPILKGEAMEDALRERFAEPIADRARGIAPVQTGQYRDSIHVVTGQHPSRAYSRVVADAPHALVVEARTHVLRRALG